MLTKFCHDMLISLVGYIPEHGVGDIIIHTIGSLLSELGGGVVSLSATDDEDSRLQIQELKKAIKPLNGKIVYLSGKDTELVTDSTPFRPGKYILYLRDIPL